MNLYLYFFHGVFIFSELFGDWNSIQLLRKGPPFINFIIISLFIQIYSDLLGLGFVDAGGEQFFSSTGDLICLVSLRVSERERERFRSAGSILFARTEFPESVMRETFRGKLKFDRKTFIFDDERERER